MTAINTTTADEDRALRNAARAKTLEIMNENPHGPNWARRFENAIRAEREAARFERPLAYAHTSPGCVGKPHVRALREDQEWVWFDA